MPNEEVRSIIKSLNLRRYDVAAAIGITPYTLCVWFRTEMPPERKNAVMQAVRQIAGQRQVMLREVCAMGAPHQNIN